MIFVLFLKVQAQLLSGSVNQHLTLSIQNTQPYGYQIFDRNNQIISHAINCKGQFGIINKPYRKQVYGLVKNEKQSFNQSLQYVLKMINGTFIAWTSDRNQIAVLTSNGHIKIYLKRSKIELNKDIQIIGNYRQVNMQFVNENTLLILHEDGVVIIDLKKKQKKNFKRYFSRSIVSHSILNQKIIFQATHNQIYKCQLQTLQNCKAILNQQQVGKILKVIYRQFKGIQFLFVLTNRSLLVKTIPGVIQKIENPVLLFQGNFDDLQISKQVVQDRITILMRQNFYTKNRGLLFLPKITQLNKKIQYIKICSSYEYAYLSDSHIYIETGNGNYIQFNAGYAFNETYIPNTNKKRINQGPLIGFEKQSNKIILIGLNSIVVQTYHKQQQFKLICSFNMLLNQHWTLKLYVNQLNQIQLKNINIELKIVNTKKYDMLLHFIVFFFLMWVIIIFIVMGFYYINKKKRVLYARILDIKKSINLSAPKILLKKQYKSLHQQSF